MNVHWLSKLCVICVDYSPTKKIYQKINKCSWMGKYHPNFDCVDATLTWAARRAFVAFRLHLRFWGNETINLPY